MVWGEGTDDAGEGFQSPVQKSMAPLADAKEPHSRPVHKMTASDSLSIDRGRVEELVSVIIPVYNGRRYLRDCLGSVLSQTHANIEVVAVDDGSTDDSAEIVESMGDPRIRLLRQRNAGRCAARNAGLRIAAGRYVKYLDQDDLLHPDNIRFQVEDLIGQPEDVISCGMMMTFEGDQPTSPTRYGFFERFPMVCDPIGFFDVLQPNAVQTSVWLTPRALHLQGGYWNEALAQNPMDDGELFLRILLRASAVRFCRESVSYHRMGHSGRGSAHDNPIKVRSLFASLELCADRLLERENSPRTREICARWFKHYLYMHYGFDKDLRSRALARMETLGFPNVRHHLGGPIFRMADRVLGAKSALAIRHRIKQWTGLTIRSVRRLPSAR